MTTNSQLSTTEPKKQKLSKQLEQEQNYRNGDYMVSYQPGERGRMGEKRKWQAQNREGKVKNSIGNGEAKQLVWT